MNPHAASIGTITDRGYSMTTYTGKVFWPTAPRPEDFDIVDIATALSRICRFGGHTKEFYSVAQHCIWVSHLVPAGYEMEALLHDRSEAYTGDMISPLKYQLPDFIKVEQRIEEVSAPVFGVPVQMSPAVKKIDTLAAWTEKRDLIVHSPDVDWGTPVEPHPQIIVPISDMNTVKKMFLNRYYELGGK